MTIFDIYSETVGDEMGSLMDERSGLGIGARGGVFPEGTAEVDDSEFFSA